MPATRTLPLPYLQLARAAVAAVAALMITFSADHSASVGLAVFSVFALVTGAVFALAVRLVFPARWRWAAVLIAAVTLAAGLVAAIPAWRSTALFFVLTILWGAVSGGIELFAGVRARRLIRAGVAVTADAPRDAILLGSLGVALAVALLCVPSTYALNYTIAHAGSFTLTGITLAVGIFGAYAAIVAVFLGIAGLTPRADAARGENRLATRTDAPAGAVATAPAENEGSA